MKYFREILIAVLGVIILLMVTCKKTKVEVIEKVVTTIDTLYFPQKERLVNVPVTKYVTVSKTDTLTLVEYKDPHFKQYEQPYEDSLLTGVIYNTVDGTLISTDIKYTPKFPKYITKETTITKTDTITKKVDKTALSLGVRTLVRPTDINPEILVSLSHKRFIYQVGYNPLNNAPSIGINYKLW